MTSIITEYLTYHTQYTKKYGPTTLVLMQIGSFYEAYAFPDNGPNLHLLEDLTDVVVTKRNTSKGDATKNNPNMWGFPVVSASKYMEILVNNGYHIVVIDQITPAPPKGKLERKVVAIYSPGTYIDSASKANSNFMAGIFIENAAQKTGSLLITGMAGIDCTTGEVYLHESYSKTNDERLGLDEAYRFINTLKPREIIIFVNDFDNNINVCKSLDIEGQLYQFKKINQTHCIVTYQRKLLESIYVDKKTLTNIFDTLEIDSKIYARNSFVSLLTYISDHQSTLIQNLSIPKFHLSEQHMLLGNNAIEQLSISGDEKKSNCLLNIINKASTNMGKRFINMRFSSPYTSPEKLNTIYNDVSFVMENNNYEKIDIQLKNIRDIERIHRNINMLSLHPFQMVELIESLKNIIILFEQEEINNISCIDDICATIDSTKKLNNLLSKTINCDIAKQYKINEISENIFVTGYCREIDEIVNQLGFGQNTINEILKKLNDMIIEPAGASSNKITLKHNKRDGYYMQTTKKRCLLLQKSMANTKQIHVGHHNINVSDIKIDNSTKITKINAPFLKGHTDDSGSLVRQISEKTLECYVDFLKLVKGEHCQTIQKIISLVTYIDYITTIAKVAKQHNYVRPRILEKSCRIHAIELRHPIVEQLIDHEYIPHTIDIGNNPKGMLIYGLNSAGKSVLMKAIGISLIMAQSGFFVPAREFNFYPFKAIYTRITGNDNIYRGLSSFSLEMVEMNAILKRATPETLIIGDEVCRGTEHISGNAIVAASLMRLYDLGAPFVFATHLHELSELDDIKSRNCIQSFHLSVDTKEDGTLIYDRILRPGNGERIYGITVAKHIIKDTLLIDKALEIKNKLLNKEQAISTKTSKYNSKILMDKCEICSKQNALHMSDLETHHIIQQKDCDNGFAKTKQHIKKNATCNLMVVCQNCHDRIHAKNICVDGKHMTSNGEKLICKQI